MFTVQFWLHHLRSFAVLVPLEVVDDLEVR